MEKKLTRISSIDSVATIWAIKKVTNKNKNIKKLTNFSGRSCIDGDATIWTTRPASAPLAQLAALAADQVGRQISLQSPVQSTLSLSFLHYLHYLHISGALF